LPSLQYKCHFIYIQAVFILRRMWCINKYLFNMYGVKVSTLLRFMHYFISFPISLDRLFRPKWHKAKKRRNTVCMIKSNCNVYLNIRQYSCSLLLSCCYSKGKWHLTDGIIGCSCRPSASIAQFYSAIKWGNVTVNIYFKIERNFLFGLWCRATDWRDIYGFCGCVSCSYG
jgi:hypothetical protein